MCGFIGKFFLNKSSYHEEDVRPMLQSIVHRGPDSEGRFSDGRVVLGFRRLSIIDTLAGDQPLYNEDRQIVVIANGEIYNYQDLSKLLKNKGHRFRSKSDCEVIVHLYEEFGPSFVNKLNGMFAFCLYDRKHEKLILSRDRIGIKPLYVYRKGGVVIFASEIKAILLATEVTVEENVDVLEEYLCFRSLSGTRTFFSGVELLPAGSVLEVSTSKVKTTTYWKAEYTQAAFDPNVNTPSRIHEALSRSVSRQLMADVPLGTQLSGGVDSSWVSCLAALESNGMKSFSVGFAESGFDESSEARFVAKIANLECHQVISDSTKFAASLAKVIWHNDEPLTHANSVEIFNLCSYAKQHVKVLLTGEGADELFGGYPRYFIPGFAQLYEKIPTLFQSGFRHAIDRLARGRGKKPSFFLGMTPEDLVFWNSAFVQSHKVAWLLDKNELCLEHRREQLNSTWDNQLSLVDNLLLYELKTYLQPILLRQDKMSMGASIEARVPILDNEMIDLALNLNSEKKIKWLCTKFNFKKAARKNLPRKIVYKRKVGFGVPVGRWMRKGGALAHYMLKIKEQSDKLPSVNPQKLEKIIYEHEAGHIDHEDILWPLMNYVLWREVFIQGKGVKP